MAAEREGGGGAIGFTPMNPPVLPQQTPGQSTIDMSNQTTPTTSTVGQTTPRQQTPVDNTVNVHQAVQILLNQQAKSIKNPINTKKQQRKGQSATPRRSTTTTTMPPPTTNSSCTSTRASPRTEAVLKPKDETSKDRMDKKADEDTGLAELRSLIDPKMLRDLKEAKVSNVDYVSN